MVQILSAVLLISAVSASASPAIPSFEFSAARLQSSIAAMRGARVKEKAGSAGIDIDRMAWALERSERDASRLRNDLRFILSRVRRHEPPANGSPDQDPSLRLDVQRFTRDLAEFSRESQWRLNELRFLTSQVQKDEALVSPASRLLEAARRFKRETNWLQFDARFAYFDFLRAGFIFEGMDLDRHSRDANERAQDLQDEADRLLTKVKP